MNSHRSSELPLVSVEPRTPHANVDRATQQGSTLLAILIVLARRKKFILWTTLIATVAACAISFVLPPEYKATVLLLPPRQGSSLSSVLGELGGLSALAGVANGSLGNNLDDLYVAMLKTESVENAVIEKYGLLGEYHEKYYVDARKKLESRTTIDGSKKDGLIRLTFEDRDAARAAEIANGYVEILRLTSAHLAITEAAQRRIIFQQQLDKAKEDLATSEEALKQTELSTGFVQLDSQARALIESAAALRAQVTAKEVQVQAMQAYAGEGNPELQEQERELAGLRQQFNQLVGTSGSSPNDLFLSKGNVPAATLDYARKLRDVKYNEAVFEALARQIEVAKVDEAREGGFLQIVNPALTPERKSFPKRAWITLGAAAFSFSLAAIIVLLQVRVAQMKANPVEAEQLAQFKQVVWPGHRAAAEPGSDTSSRKSTNASDDDIHLDDAVNR